MDEKENGIPKFVKWQIYFEFVPPPLNNFDYCMNKLSNIERSLQNLFPHNASEPMLPRYMSFTFIHGNHMDLNHASMKLFDAEPGKLYCNNIQFECFSICFFFKKTYVSELKVQGRVSVQNVTVV